tara:strand:- start:5068 stop:5892 length:825 start_codon:yes stop_codon:yes gene_type:complete
MLYAVYRCLYGEDFIQESINSITDHVDKIFIFWDDRAWGNINHCMYKGARVDFPEKFDNILDKIKELNNDKIVLIYDHVENNRNQFTHLVNNHILPNYEKPDEIMVIEVDHVFTKEQLEESLDIFRSNNIQHCDTRQIEVWKGLKHCVPRGLRKREKRPGVVFWNLKNLDRLPATNRQANGHGKIKLPTHVYNLGFAVSKEVMFWKHMTAIGFSQKIGDTPPNEDWYEKIWLAWDYETNNENLEISKGYEHYIPLAEEYDWHQLPESIKDKIKT